MRISLKHEAMRAGNVSVTDIYNCSEVELRTMVERDRCLRAIRMGCSPRDIALRTPQTILQELWNAEERSAHAYYRSDRVSGVICSYEDLVGAGREPQGCSASSEDILLCAEDARERANCLQAIFAEIEKLPAVQRLCEKFVPLFATKAKKRRTRQHHQFVKERSINGSFQCYQSERKPVI